MNSGFSWICGCCATETTSMQYRCYISYCLTSHRNYERMPEKIHNEASDKRLACSILSIRFCNVNRTLRLKPESRAAWDKLTIEFNWIIRKINWYPIRLCGNSGISTRRTTVIRSTFITTYLCSLAYFETVRRFFYNSTVCCIKNTVSAQENFHSICTRN